MNHQPTLPALTAALLVSLGAAQASIAGTTVSTASNGDTVYTISNSATCPQGGTRVSSGTWDTTSGAIDLSTTISACVLGNGEQQDGSSSLKGTLTLATSTVDATIDLTITDNFKATQSNGSSVTRTATTTKKGSFKQSTLTFTGTTSSSESTSGAVRDDDGLAQNLLREVQILPSSAAPAGAVWSTAGSAPAAGGPGGHPGGR